MSEETKHIVVHQATWDRIVALRVGMLPLESVIVALLAEHDQIVAKDKAKKR